jgi:hypothetical protein
MSAYLFSHRFRAGLIAALPEDTAQFDETPAARHLYLPASHAKALHPNTTLIQGMRGSGKSFWFAALQSGDLRALLGSDTGLSAETVVSVGFGQRPLGKQFPSKRTLKALHESGIDPQQIWSAVVFQQLLGADAPQQFAALEDWQARVQWMTDHPEVVDECWYQADTKLERQGQYHIVLFDALDRTADDWPTMNRLVRGLLQVVLDTRAFRRIRLKVFARPDQLEDPIVANFPDASKVLNQKIVLEWPRRELYGLLWQYLANEPEHGEPFRSGVQAMLPNIQWKQEDGIWLVPAGLRRSEEMQKSVFHAFTGPWMGKDKRRGFPYSWLPSHLGDARGEVSPRSFLSALRHAAQDEPRVTQEFALHYESIKRGVQEASKIRVRELEEDYPWVRPLFEPLAGITVPCHFDEISRVWRQQRVVEELERGIADQAVRLPPSHISEGEDGVLLDLIGLGLVERLKDGRINLPDVYRVGYGMGRRGGVRPVAG